MGGAAGLAAVLGLGLLPYRRLRVVAIRRASGRSDRLALPLPPAPAGARAARRPDRHRLLGAPHEYHDYYDYRLRVAVWFRSLFVLDPDIGATAHAPLVHRLHALLALALFALFTLFALFALWPFNRLVHASPSHWVTSSARTSSTDRGAGRGGRP
ncbi:respiratory nitrate reductase subunit gamma [Streptomyces sp. NPDC002521]